MVNDSFYKILIEKLSLYTKERQMLFAETEELPKEKWGELPSKIKFLDGRISKTLHQLQTSMQKQASLENLQEERFAELTIRMTENVIEITHLFNEKLYNGEIGPEKFMEEYHVSILDSFRDDCHLWATQFELNHLGKQYYYPDYYEEIRSFAEAKLKDAGYLSSELY